VKSVTVAVKIVVPGVVGVPEINPEGSSVRPPGKASVVVNVRGPIPKMLLSVSKYGVPTTPDGRVSEMGLQGVWGGAGDDPPTVIVTTSIQVAP
jgi:hypothetical protein